MCFFYRIKLNISSQREVKGGEKKGSDRLGVLRNGNFSFNKEKVKKRENKTTKMFGKSSCF
jgi:hypothetical protein